MANAYQLGVVMMWQQERQQKILQHLSAFGRISIDRAVDDFAVSRETIRRDLMEMERSGLLRRVRGGAVLFEKQHWQQPPFQIRHTERLREKRAIAATALQFVQNGMTIFMDAGSTAIIMAERLAGPNGLNDITIITNSIDVGRTILRVEEERSARFRVIMLGGELKQNPLEMVGSITINAIYHYGADLALLVPWGINAEQGGSYYHSTTAEIARAMAQNVAQTLILADHSKIGAPARAVFCLPDEIDVLITDSAARKLPAFDELRGRLAKTIIADGK